MLHFNIWFDFQLDPRQKKLLFVNAIEIWLSIFNRPHHLLRWQIFLLVTAPKQPLFIKLNVACFPMDSTIFSIQLFIAVMPPVFIKLEIVEVSFVTTLFCLVAIMKIFTDDLCAVLDKLCYITLYSKTFLDLLCEELLLSSILSPFKALFQIRCSQTFTCMCKFKINAHKNK